MPLVSKQRMHCRNLNDKRYREDHSGRPSESDVSEEEDAMEVEQHEENVPLDFGDKSILNEISDLFELCMSKCPLKYISVLLYMSVRHFGVAWQDCNNFLVQIGALTAETAHKWAKVFTSGDLDEFCMEGRGGNRGSDFYDLFPEIETNAKLFSVERCSRKSADFTSMDLAHYIDEQYYSITETVKDDNAALVRSSQSCRLDLRRWGARFESNGNRPYFEGHERKDVLDHRSKFIEYFLTRKDHYYTITDGVTPMWTIPTKSPAIVLLCESRFRIYCKQSLFSLLSTCSVHDESTFKSGEVSNKRWFLGEQAPFHSKGRGRSNMVSDFLVQHPSGPFFSLSEKEFSQAVKQFPELEWPSDIDFLPRSATACISLGRDSYFDNVTILEQFERLFKLMKFKTEFKNAEVQCIVDNARTHSAKSHSISDFAKSIGRKCPIEKFDYTDSHGSKQTLDCYFREGPNKGKSKGLVEIAKELNVKIAPTMKLEELRKQLVDHPAFITVRRVFFLGSGRLAFFLFLRLHASNS
jgi:hypothetical protein